MHCHISVSELCRVSYLGWCAEADVKDQPRSRKPEEAPAAMVALVASPEGQHYYYYFGDRQID